MTVVSAAPYGPTTPRETRLPPAGRSLPLSPLSLAQGVDAKQHTVSHVYVRFSGFGEPDKREPRFSRDSKRAMGRTEDQKGAGAICECNMRVQMRVIDGDSHFIEPLDLFERYTDPAYRDRTVRVGVDSSGRVTGLIVDNRPMRMADLDELMSACAGYGEKEEGRSISDFDLYRIASQKWQDMDLRIGYLVVEGFAAQVLYPHDGTFVGKHSVDEPSTRRRTLPRVQHLGLPELVAGHKDRLFPAAHISMRDATLAARNEMARVARPQMPHHLCRRRADRQARASGNPDFDPIWAAGARGSTSPSASISSAIPTTPAASGTAPAIPASCTSR